MRSLLFSLRRYQSKLCESQLSLRQKCINHHNSSGIFVENISFQRGADIQQPTSQSLAQAVSIPQLQVKNWASDQICCGLQCLILTNFVKTRNKTYTGRSATRRVRRLLMLAAGGVNMQQIHKQKLLCKSSDKVQCYNALVSLYQIHDRGFNMVQKEMSNRS